MKASNLERISQEISNKFFGCFSADLKNWNGDIECFVNFDKEADRILKLEGGAVVIDMEKFLQEKKIKRLQEKEEQTEKAKLILIEMEKFLRKKKKD